MTIEEHIWLPALSGFLVQLINLLEVARLEPARRPNFSDWVYWLPYLIGPVLGGFAGYLSFTDRPESFSILIGAQVGASAPLLLKGLASAVPPGTQKQKP